MLAAPAAAAPSCTLPPDLIERFVRFRAWHLEFSARESLWSDEFDRRFYAASGVTDEQYRDLDHNDPRRQALGVARDKIYAEMPDNDEKDEHGQTECDRLSDERWAVAEAMLDHEPHSIVDLAWQAEAWLLADLELYQHDNGNPLLGTIFRNIRMLGALPQPEDPFGALTIVASDAANDEVDEEAAVRS
ncbi:hypothetical protein [Rhodoplanes sp. JGI PP 4-B12]|uniref:hypothetical protein n=1 Tax=Rhodoplanes sp. JGI PP 4-B12 TaxID=1873883 RepID=UPI000B50E2C3|nr:hypothetical protein [Rhodoplanes sp. JGI PP 4-B12]